MGIKLALKSFIAVKSSSKLIQLVADNFNEANFKWVFNSVNSRCFYLDDSEMPGGELSLGNKLFGTLVKEKKSQHGSFKEFLANVEMNEEIDNNMCCLIPFVDMLNHCLVPNGRF